MKKLIDYPLGTWLVNKHNRQIAKILREDIKKTKGTYYTVYTLKYLKGQVFSAKYGILKRNWVYSEAAQVLYSRAYEGRS